MPLSPGKLPPELLARLMGGIPAPATDARVVVGPRPGVDAAVLDMGDRYLVATADPITLVSDRLGWYAVHVNANDVAAMGGTPRWMLATVLLPDGCDEHTIFEIQEGMVAAAGPLGIALIGGHTEVTAGIDRPLVAVTMLGEVAKERLVTSAGARPADRILLAGSIAVEGTAALAVGSAQHLRAAGVGDGTLARAAALVDRPGISVLPAARALTATVRPHAMHDATEGGVATALAELAGASGVGMRVERERLTLLPETRTVCAALGLDPLGLLSSGLLIAAVAPEDEVVALTALAQVGVAVASVGWTTTPEDGLRMIEGGQSRPWPIFARDELARFFDEGPGVGSRGPASG